MEKNAFTSLAVFKLPSTCRLLASSCCPDKDLVVLISRLGGKDRISLWKIQGSKKWEVDVGTGENRSEEVVGLTWSPDGQSIAVAHDPPCITLHSIQDGREERRLSVNVPIHAQRRLCRITSVWWFREEKVTVSSSIPDIFRRGTVITGTAHSILRTLPLLDHLQEHSQKLTATDLFAFQGSQTRLTKPSLPDVIKSWPNLLSDALSASIQDNNQSNASSMDEVDDSNVNSILAVADDLGHIHCFLDGSFSLGAIPLGSELSTLSLFKDPKRPVFFAHPQVSSDAITLTDLMPVIIKLPLLEKRVVRDLAKSSSTARDLVWYAMRVVKEMRSVWFGSEGYSGARELGPKWIRALETKQKDQFGQEEPNPMFELTCLLVAGRLSESLQDFLGNGEQMSERGIQKWESTVTEALVKLRDFSEKRVAPACQRLHLILQEVQGWSMLPNYMPLELPTEDIKTCLDLVNRAIVISSWLAAVARRELSRFKEFISWLKYESIMANANIENHPSPRHDILEVNNYFMSGLLVSSIDKWFMGPVPQFSPRDLGVPGDNQDLYMLLQRAQAVADDPAQMAWQLDVKQKDLNHLDRNLDALIQDLAIRCHRIFVHASAVAARSAVISLGPGSAVNQAGARPDPQPSHHLVIRERIARNDNQAGNFLQYLATHMPSGHRTFLCLVQMRHGHEAAGLPLHVGVALLECRLAPEVQQPYQEPVDFDLLEVDFFDDEFLVIVYRLRTKDASGSTFIATVSYNDLGYQELRPEWYVNIPTREDLMLGAMQWWKEGRLHSVQISIKRCRALAACGNGEISVAVNGRLGRRVACLLDSKGTSMEAIDLEGEGEGEDGEAQEGDPEMEAEGRP